ncbi:hypothetical protein M8J77_018921 [Diaphorina citri]|nr:hypothetical protein M8J77_018921 [Diaphorina citri]
MRKNGKQGIEEKVGMENRGNESKTSDKTPVLVYIHGESFSWNSGSVYDGTVLSSFASMVVVTVNYRLGILGFLNPSKDYRARIPANFGLLDQIAALHWIKENIGEFGGDPSNISLMGHGTGAACINFLMTSPAVPDGEWSRFLFFKFFQASRHRVTSLMMLSTSSNIQILAEFRRFAPESR